MLALSTLLWRREVPAHEYVSRFRDKEKFTDVMLDKLAPILDLDAVDNEVWCLESMNGEEIERPRAFVLAVWTFTVTSLSAYRGKRGLDPKIPTDQREAEDEDPGLPACSQGCTGAAEEEVVARRPVAMKAKFRIEGSCTQRSQARSDGCYKCTRDGVSRVQGCGEGREAPLVSRMPQV